MPLIQRLRCRPPATSTRAAAKATRSGSCRSSEIAASDPSFAEPNFEPADDKIYRHPTFYDIPDEVGHM
jgi:phenylacetate-CoA oxygenase PaaH subunit